jgi:hypothetical protein
MKESNLSKAYLPKWQAENGKDSHLFRNNTGSAYQGKIFEAPFFGKFEKVLRDLRIITFGIGLLRRKNKKSPYRPVGGGDYIGWTSKTVCNLNPELFQMNLIDCDSKGSCDNCELNKSVAIFTSIEFKTKNVSETKDQKDWKELVRNSGGIAEVVKEGE